jgi:hypothetical protein
MLIPYGEKIYYNDFTIDIYALRAKEKTKSKQFLKQKEKQHANPITL